MQKTIPAVLIAHCAEVASRRETHATLDSLFVYAGASGDPPTGSNHAEALEWLRAINKDETLEPIDVLGRLIEEYMEEPLDPEDTYHQDRIKDRNQITDALSRSELQYAKGGKIISALGAPSRTLEEYIREGDAASIDLEFNRAQSNVDTGPREAVSAASNILESICKVYIEEEGLDRPGQKGSGIRSCNRRRSGSANDFVWSHFSRGWNWIAPNPCQLCARGWQNCI
jgi:hypothetical protein